MQAEGQKGADMYSLNYLYAATGTSMIPTATVEIKKGDKVSRQACFGDGPVDATFKAINEIVKEGVSLLDYQIKSVTKGEEAQGEVTLRIKKGRTEVNGRGVSTDIIEASAKAYLDALSKLDRAKAVKIRK